MNSQEKKSENYIAAIRFRKTQTDLYDISKLVSCIRTIVIKCIACQ